MLQLVSHQGGSGGWAGIFKRPSEPKLIISYLSNIIFIREFMNDNDKVC